MKKLLIILAIFALLGAGGYFLKDRLPLPARESAESRLPAATVTLRDIVKSVDVSGYVEPLIATEVKSEVSGKILNIYVDNGANVRKGDKLVELDKTLAQADFDEAERNLTIQESALKKNQRDYERLQKLFADGFATERDMLDAKTAMEQSEISVAVQGARIAKQRENLDKTTILAPHDGMVSNLDITPGQVVIGAGSVNNGTTLMKVNDLSQMIVQANLNEFDVAKIALSTPAQLSFDSLPELKLGGNLFYISPSGISSGTGSAASLSTALRVFPIKVSFEAPGKSIRPGISANISMVIARAEQALAVPISAVFIEGRDRFMFVRDAEGKFAQKNVGTGINNDGYIEITEGVSEGDVVSLVRPGKAN